MTRSRLTKRFGAFILATLWAASAVAAPIVFNNQGAFLAQLGPSTTFDFETTSGFPIANTGPLNAFSAAPVGFNSGVNFVGHTYSGLSVSGRQSFTGDSNPNNTPTFNAANVLFGGPPSRPRGVGFFGLDLTNGEKIQLDVLFSNAGLVSYNITLGGAPALTPIYFGVLDNSDSIVGLRIFGSNIGQGAPNRAWAIDDLTIGNAAVPEPSTYLLFALGLGFMGLARRKNPSA